MPKAWDGKKFALALPGLSAGPGQSKGKVCCSRRVVGFQAAIIALMSSREPLPLPPSRFRQGIVRCSTSSDTALKSCGTPVHFVHFVHPVHVFPRTGIQDHLRGELAFEEKGAEQVVVHALAPKPEVANLAVLVTRENQKPLGSSHSTYPRALRSSSWRSRSIASEGSPRSR